MQRLRAENGDHASRDNRTLQSSRCVGCGLVEEEESRKEHLATQLLVQPCLVRAGTSSLFLG